MGMVVSRRERDVRVVFVGGLEMYVDRTVGVKLVLPSIVSLTRLGNGGWSKDGVRSVSFRFGRLSTESSTREGSDARTRSNVSDSMVVVFSSRTSSFGHGVELINLLRVSSDL